MTDTNVKNNIRETISKLFEKVKTTKFEGKALATRDKIQLLGKNIFEAYKKEDVVSVATEMYFEIANKNTQLKEANNNPAYKGDKPDYKLESLSTALHGLVKAKDSGLEFAKEEQQQQEEVNTKLPDSNINKAYKDLLEECKKLLASKETLLKQNKKLEEQIKQLTTDKESETEQKNQLNTQLEETKKLLNQEKNNNAQLTKKGDDKDKRIEQLQDKMSELEDKENELQELLETYRTTVNDLELNKKDLEEKGLQEQKRIGELEELIKQLVENSKTNIQQQNMMVKDGQSTIKQLEQRVGQLSGANSEADKNFNKNQDRNIAVK